jgi:hypothetical protein
LTQALPQALVVPPQEGAHAPLAQTLPLLQVVPQAPQLPGSLVVSKHRPPHAVWPLGHWHEPWLHVSPPEHAMPQVPQLTLSLLVFVHWPPHGVSPV